MSDDALSRLKPSLFISSPGEILAQHVAFYFAQVPQFAKIFNFIDSYRRMDYGMRNLPAIRFFVEQYTKQFDSWFITGDLTADVILPASLRRTETEDIPSFLCAAILQQFRRPSFFVAINNLMPGLNELGKTYSVDKSLAFQPDSSSEIVPMTRLTINFRIDLREWDDFLESDDRTKDDPFERTLEDLEKLFTTIQGTTGTTTETATQVIGPSPTVVNVDSDQIIEKITI